MSDESTETNGNLIINELTLEDDGEYECFVREQNSKNRVRLTVVPGRSSNFRQSVEKQAGESVELYCEFTNERDLRWRKLEGVFNI